MFVQPGEHERAAWISSEQGALIRQPSGHTFRRNVPCSNFGCSSAAGFEGLPLCEYCAWKAYALLRSVEDADAKREAARREYAEWECQERAKEKAAQEVREQRWRKETIAHPGWIYYLLVGDLVKIGYTVDPSQRMKQYPPNSSLLATHPGTLKTERQMHSKFWNSLAKGREWFTPTSDLIEHIKEARNTYESCKYVDHAELDCLYNLAA